MAEVVRFLILLTLGTCVIVIGSIAYVLGMIMAITHGAVIPTLCGTLIFLFMLYIARH